MEKLIEMQNELKVPKGNFNSFGKYKYRSCEDILEALKPILLKHKATLILSDSIEAIGSKVFLKAEAILTVPGNALSHSQTSVTGFAELQEHKGMSAEQATGTASSYARKYALNGLFLIDETEADADSQKPEKQKETPAVTIMITPEQKADLEKILKNPFLNEKEISWIKDKAPIETMHKVKTFIERITPMLKEREAETLSK